MKQIIILIMIVSMTAYASAQNTKGVIKNNL